MYINWSLIKCLLLTFIQSVRGDVKVKKANNKVGGGKGKIIS